MSLDTVELIFDLEERFKQKIPEHVAIDIATVGDIAQFFIKTIPFQTPDNQLKGKLFIRFHAACRQLRLPFLHFNLQSSIAEIIPENH